MNGNIGKSLVFIGLTIAVMGLLFMYKDSIPLIKNLGRLPGDINIKRENFSFYFPVVTCILLSIIASLVFYVIGKLR